jgi:hypothetical protein
MFTICLFISPGLDGNRGTRKNVPRETHKGSRNSEQFGETQIRLGSHRLETQIVANQSLDPRSIPTKPITNHQSPVITSEHFTFTAPSTRNSKSYPRSLYVVTHVTIARHQILSLFVTFFQTVACRDRDCSEVIISSKSMSGVVAVSSAEGGGDGVPDIEDADKVGHIFARALVGIETEIIIQEDGRVSGTLHG